MTPSESLPATDGLASGEPEGPATPVGSSVAGGPVADDTLVTPSIVDWGRTARRMRVVLTVLGLTIIVGWVALGLLGSGGFRPRLLAELTGLGVLVAIGAEIVVVGGAAVRGMLRAGERGDRLAGPDVSLFPPQLRRRG